MNVTHCSYRTIDWTGSLDNIVPLPGPLDPNTQISAAEFYLVVASYTITGLTTESVLFGEHDTFQSRCPHAQ